MSARYGSLPSVTNHYGTTGLGVLGSVVSADTATGAHGAGYLYNDWAPGDDAKEFRGVIVTPPATGTLFAREDGSFDFTPAGDGSYSFTYRLFVDGLDLGTAVASFTVGAIAPITAVVAATGAIIYTGAAAVVATIGSPPVTADVAATGTVVYSGVAAVVASIGASTVDPDPDGVRLEDWLHRVLPYVPGCPDQTALLHIIDAAKMFCRRTLAWNYQHAAITTVAGQADYSMSLAAGVRVAKVLACEIQGGAVYVPVRGGIGRQYLRNLSGPSCLLSGTQLSLSPAPVVGGQPLLVEIAVMPDDSGVAVWPDDLEEHIEFIAYGAIGTLCVMPGVSWRDVSTAGINAALFQQRMNAVYHTTVRTLAPPAGSSRGSVMF